MPYSVLLYELITFAGTFQVIPSFVCIVNLILALVDNVCLEAMTSGIPVVTSKVNGVSEIMEGMDNLLLDDPCDIKSMTTKIKSLLIDDVEREKVGINCRKIAERYTMSNNAKHFLKVYNAILKCRDV